MKLNHILLGFFVLLFSVSCSSDLDFDQINDLELQPVVIANLSSFDVAANQFVNNGTEQSVSIDTPEVGVFNDSFFQDNLSRADLFFEVDNTINRPFSLQLFFLNASNIAVSSIKMDIQAYSGGTNLITQTVIYKGVSLDLLKQTKKIAFVIRLLPGPPLSATSIGNLKLRSSATAYFDIK